jgi:hypothetical protein
MPHPDPKTQLEALHQQQIELGRKIKKAEAEARRKERALSGPCRPDSKPKAAASTARQGRHAAEFSMVAPSICLSSTRRRDHSAASFARR